MKCIDINKTHYPRIAEIYAQGIATGIATFETDVPDWETWDNGHLSFGRRAAENNGMIVGWAALSTVSGRCAYKGVAEMSIYVDQEYRGKGVGSLLIDDVIRISETHGIWTVQSSMFSTNKASQALHRSAGFREVGIRERIGQINGQWYDNIIFERRSKITGIQ